MVVEIDLLLEVGRPAVEIGEEVGLVVVRLFDARQRVDNRLGVDLLLDVDRYDWDGEVLAVLFVLPFPDQLRIEGGIARVEHGLGGQFFVGHKVPQLLGGDIGSLILVPNRFDFGRSRFLLSHTRYPLLALLGFHSPRLVASSSYRRKPLSRWPDWIPCQAPACACPHADRRNDGPEQKRRSEGTRLDSSHHSSPYAVFCLKK